MMAETEKSSVGSDGKDSASYKPPPPKSLKELQDLDKDDESLNKYKRSLLGDDVDLTAVTGEGTQVTLDKLVIIADAHEDIILDLTGDLAELKKKTFTIKEGVGVQAKLTFTVKNDIVFGLKYLQNTTRSAVHMECDSAVHMMGSYGPSKDIREYKTQVEEFSKGVLVRGHYTVQSKLMDDDDRVFLTWEWAFDIKSDWD
ncbi:rho GDP-dissociation inhibitor 2-like [Asterias amurensis]|uniref:rho GDP-dissociation inhibitor 2-like n=1 Tax=Asterias amurensis TaxID=7602 RepID=UPI003AB3B9F8